MKKFLLLLLSMSHLLLSVEEKTIQQKTKNFLLSKPMMIVYGAVAGGTAVKIFLYDPLEKDMKQLAGGFALHYETTKYKDGMLGLLRYTAEKNKKLFELKTIDDTAILLSMRDSMSPEVLTAFNELNECLIAYNEIVHHLGGKKKVHFADYNQADGQGIIFFDLMSDQNNQKY